MAAGDLSADQARYRDRVVAGTGLDARVVTAWIGEESGWGITKPNRNYLNLMEPLPGGGQRQRTYASVDAAAAAAVKLIKESGDYGGIRASVGKSPEEQATAIGDSKWGTIKDRLLAVLGVRPLAGREAADPWTNPLTAVTDAFGGLGEDLKVAGVFVAFTVAALALMVLGALRLVAQSKTVADVGQITSAVSPIK